MSEWNVRITKRIPHSREGGRIMADHFPDVGASGALVYMSILVRYSRLSEAIELFEKLGFTVDPDSRISEDWGEACCMYLERGSIPVQLISFKPPSVKLPSTPDEFTLSGNYIAVTVEDTRSFHLAISVWAKERGHIMVGSERPKDRLLIMLPTLFTAASLELVPCLPEAA
jgi:hypothetical protein